MRSLVSAVLVFGVATGAAAQTPRRPASPDAEQKQSRYQIGQMERTLEGAADHAAKNIRDRLEAVVPATMLVAESSRVRGFRLDGYGVFFDVVAPSMDFTLPMTLMRSLDQNDLGLESALKSLRAYVDSSKDRDLQQALKRVELQVTMPSPMPRPRAANTATRNSAGAPAAAMQADAPADDELLNNPLEAYRAEVREALTDAMIDYSGPLAIGAEEWLSIGVRRNDERPQLAPADTDAMTMILRVKGADLAAFRAGRLTRDEILQHVEVRVF